MTAAGFANDESVRLLPLFLDLRRRSVLIFGGGEVGERKARLFSSHARVVVASREFSPGLLQMAKEGLLNLVEVELSEGYNDLLRDAFIVVPATSDSRLNRAIEDRASEMGVLVNKVDGVGDVVVPSIIRKEPIAIAISSQSPALTKYLRLRLERELSENFRQMALLLGQMRAELKEHVPLQKERARIIWEILDDEEIWKLLDVSYEKAYMKAREHATFR
jgi:precorrin-2 dehydrogenase/sirohydrochlorin ferrochelatase